MMCAKFQPHSLPQLPLQSLGTPAWIEHDTAHLIREIQSNPFRHLPQHTPLQHHQHENHSSAACIACHDVNLIQSGHTGRHGHLTFKINQTTTHRTNSRVMSTNIQIFQ